MDRLVEHNSILVGHIIRGKYRTVRRPEHFFKKFQGFGISESVLSALEKAGVEDILLIYQGKRGDQLYKQKVAEYRDPLKSKAYTYQGDKQRILPIK